ncbi:MAG: efflux RND transporter periplasmic adaptor subunit [Coriobacteriia bacterium]
MKQIMKKRPAWSIAIALAALVLVASSAYYGYAASAAEDEAPVRTATVTRDTIQKSVPAEGRVEVDRWELSFPAQGTVATVNVKPGDTVVAGQVLATLASGKADAQLAQAQAALAAADAKLDGILAGPAATDVAVKQASLDAAIASLASAREAYDLLVAQSLESTVSAAELQAKQTSVSNAESAVRIAQANLAAAQAGSTSDEVAAARAAVAQAQASADSASLGTGDLVLVAPVDGTVIEVNIKAGSIVSSGGAAALVMADLEHLYVEAALDENDYAKAEVGLPVDVLVDALEGTSLEGTVTVLSPVGSVDQNGIATYALITSLDAAGSRAAAGMTVRLDVIIERAEDVLVIPNEAVSLLDGKQVVSVLGENGSTTTVTVELGMTDGSIVEVVSGLESGQRVILPAEEQ